MAARNSTYNHRHNSCPSRGGRRERSWNVPALLKWSTLHFHYGSSSPAGLSVTWKCHATTN
jgi:hypothetical protein